MEQSTSVNGKRTLDTDMESKSGQMEQNTKDSGKITKLMERELSGTSTVTNTMVNGEKTRLMVEASILIVTAQLTMDFGSMISNMVMD